MEVPGFLFSYVIANGLTLAAAHPRKTTSSENHILGELGKSSKRNILKQTRERKKIYVVQTPNRLIVASIVRTVYFYDARNDHPCVRPVLPCRLLKLAKPVLDCRVAITKSTANGSLDARLPKLNACHEELRKN